MDKYEKLENACGRVYQARDKETGRFVALKKTTLEMEEVSLLQMLSHSSYVVRLLCTEHIEKNGKAFRYLVFEYLDTNLKKFIDYHTEALPPSIIQSFLYQLCHGVAHCHSHGVLHRDLKPQNLLVDKDKGILKIAHLPLTRSLKTSSEIMSRRYRAPEMLLESPHYSTGADMWSVGCIFAEMARKHALFPEVSEFEQFMLISSLLGTSVEKRRPDVYYFSRYRDMYPHREPQNLASLVPSLGPEGIDLLSKMLKYDPHDRISAMAALDHPYFDTLDKSQFQIFVVPT